MRILVTGCAGYIGSKFLAAILGDLRFTHPKLRKIEVVGVDNLMYQNGLHLGRYLDLPFFEFHNLDIRNQEAMLPLLKTSDVIVHLAALVGEPVCKNFSKTYVKEVNYGATKFIVDNLRQSQKIIFTNTNSGYGTTSGKEKVDENSPMNPISIYGKTKCEAEKCVTDHVNSLVFRLATVYGIAPRMRFDLLVNDFTSRVFAWKKNSSPLPALNLFEPHYKRNHIYIDDVVSLLFAGIMGTTSNSAWTGVFNAGNKNANSKLEIAEFICDTLEVNKSKAIEICDGKDPDQRNYDVSSEKILKETTISFLELTESSYLIHQIAKLCSLVPFGDTSQMRNK